MRIKPLGPFSWDLAVSFASGLPGLRHQAARLSDKTFTPVAVNSLPGIPAVKLERLHGVAKAALEGLLDAEHLISLGDKAPDAVRHRRLAGGAIVGCSARRTPRARRRAFC